MKNIIIVLIVTVALLLQMGTEAFGQRNCYTTTPRGTRVDMYCYDGYEPLSAAQISAINQHVDWYYPSSYRIGNASGKYNCHSFAWWYSSASNYAWMNTPNDDKYWNDGSYRTATWSTYTRISYTYGDHSGRNYNRSYPNWIYSKWGQWPRMVHWYTDAPYNSSTVRLYKR